MFYVHFIINQDTAYTVFSGEVIIQAVFSHSFSAIPEMKRSVVASIALLACLGFHREANADSIINFSDFSSASGYTLLGTAQKVGNTLQLVPSSAYSTGGVFFNTPVDVSSGFSASFSFTFSKPGAGDGMAFVIKNPESNGSNGGLGGYGEQLGYATRYSVKGIDKSVAVEFDSHVNNTVGTTSDINDNHIGIDANASVLSLEQVAVVPDFNNVNPWYAWVDYDGASLSVSVNQTGERPVVAMLSYGTLENPFIISDYTGSPTALVGFTSSTGGATQTTTLRTFGLEQMTGFEAMPEPSTLAFLGTGALFASITSRRKARNIMLAEEMD
jgi:hypothetical protein